MENNVTKEMGPGESDIDNDDFIQRLPSQTLRDRCVRLPS
jgi:hypothetical protein